MAVTGPIAAAPAVKLEPGDRVIVQRCWLPDISSRVIAASLPGGVSVAFDAATCRLASAWRGGFLDMQATWTGRGAGPARVVGERFFGAPDGIPLRIGGAANPPVRFLGYRIGRDSVEFRYEIAGVPVVETLCANGGSLTRHFHTGETQEPLRFHTGGVGTLSAGQPGSDGWVALTSQEFTHTIPPAAPRR